MEKEAVRAKKLEDRLRVVTKGYVAREEALRADIAALWEAAQTTQQVRICDNATMFAAKVACELARDQIISDLHAPGENRELRLPASAVECAAINQAVHMHLGQRH